MAYPSTAPFKRGDSFALTCTHKVAGVAASLAGVTIRAQLRNAFGGLVCDLVATIATDQIASPGLFSLRPSDQSLTRTWPAPGLLSCDIEFTSGGTVYSSSTFTVPVEKDITV